MKGLNTNKGPEFILIYHSIRRRNHSVILPNPFPNRPSRATVLLACVTWLFQQMTD